MGITKALADPLATPCIRGKLRRWMGICKTPIQGNPGTRANQKKELYKAARGPSQGASLRPPEFLIKEPWDAKMRDSRKTEKFYKDPEGP